MSNDNKPAAAQEAVAWMAEPVMQSMRSRSRVFCSDKQLAMQWDYSGHPDYGRMIVTPLYAAPVAAAPSAEAIELTVCCGREECGGECGNEWLGTEWVRKAATPAAPGIDLRQFRSAVVAWKRDAESRHHAGEIFPEQEDAIWKEADRLLALIDASPKGGSTDAEPMFYIQDTRSFVGNCPVWWGPNGNGYVTRLDEAGRFTEQEAIAQNRTRDTDVPWPCAEIDKLGRITVDVQHMRPRRERLAELQATSAEVGA